MSVASDIWVRRAFKLGAWSFGIGIFVAFFNALYLILNGTYQLVDRVPLFQTFGHATLIVFAICTFVLWLKSWAVVFPGKTVDSGYRPLVWALLLIFGFWVTPWYVIYQAMKENVV